MENPFDKLSWMAVLYLANKTKEYDFADCLDRDVGVTVRPLIVQSLVKKAKATFGSGYLKESPIKAFVTEREFENLL